MEPDRRCAKCGQAIPWGETDCPLCSERRGYLVAAARYIPSHCVRAYDPSVRHHDLYHQALLRGEKGLGAGLVQPG